MALLLAVALLLMLPATLVAQNNPHDLINNNVDPFDTVQSQEPEGIVYDTGEEPDSLMPGYVYGFAPTLRAVKITAMQHPLLSPDGVEMHNPVHRFDGDFYTDLGALGQSHRSLYPYALDTRQLLDGNLGNAALRQQWTMDASPIYRQLMHPQPFMQTLRPFTHLQYGSSINKDYQIRVVHSQNIKPRWNFAFFYDLVSRDGLYTNSELTNHSLDFSTNYYSSDARYQLQALVTFNRLRQQENGGVADDETCWDNGRRAGVPVNMYSAQNQWRDLELHLHQSFNTVRQFQEIRPIVEKLSADSTMRDTIVGYDTLSIHSPRTFNTGVFALDVDFAKHRRIFSDNQSNSWFYDYGAIDTTFYYDSTSHYQLSAELYWTNDAYMSHRWRNPIVLTVGVRPEHNTLRYAVSSKDYFSTSLFARSRFHLGRFALSADAEEVNGGERTGDYRIDATAELHVGKHSRFSAAVLSEAQAPALMYYYNEGCYAWSHGSFNKEKRQQVAIGYALSLPDSATGHLRMLTTRTSATLLGDRVWFDSTMTPVQGNASGLLLQATVETRLRFGWFNVRMQQMVQHSSDPDVVRVPLFATKNSFYADIHLFRRSLRMQTGFDLRYHTRYYADGWNPVLGAFYRQDNVEVGNYIVADFWLTLQIKRATIYAKVSHFNAPLERHPSYFSLPHYPMEDLGVYWGVVWKFFN